MVPSNSLDEYMTRAVSHYSSLFTLPSHSKIILSLGVLCLLSGVSATLPFLQFPQKLFLGSLFGVALFLVVVLSDSIVYRTCMKADPIFDLRRCSALSLFSWLVWLGFIVPGSVASIFVESLDLWVKTFFLSLSAVLAFRLLVFSATSFADYGGVFISSILQPAFSVIIFFFFGPLLGYTVEGYLLLLPLFSIFIAVVTVFVFTFLLDHVGKTDVGFASLSLFKAFLANWIADLNSPLEHFLERMGVEKNIRAYLLGFKANEKMKAVIVVPACHRGPFKNVGSSLLPYIIQDALANKLRCVVAVPHGLCGHETDLSSQFQNKKVLESVLRSVDSFSSVNHKATSFVRVHKEGASASCQIFGDCAVFTLTLAPQTTEDLPEELDSVITSAAEKAGKSRVMVINAHNSIEGASYPNEADTLLREVALTSLKKAVIDKYYPFEIGAATIIPKEFSVKEGMGPGGIGVIVVRVGDQRVAYITIDGNNMVSGLRERVLSMLPELSITDGEVLTTDTHVVNGVVRTTRGYYSVGEAMDQERLIKYIKQATNNALNNMEPAEALWTSEVTPQVKVIGKKQIERLCLLADKTLSQAKRLAALIFPSVGALLTTLILLL